MHHADDATQQLHLGRKRGILALQIDALSVKVMRLCSRASNLSNMRSILPLSSATVMSEKPGPTPSKQAQTPPFSIHPPSQHHQHLYTATQHNASASRAPAQAHRLHSTSCPFLSFQKTDTCVPLQHHQQQPCSGCCGCSGNCLPSHQPHRSRRSSSTRRRKCSR